MRRIPRVAVSLSVVAGLFVVAVFSAGTAMSGDLFRSEGMRGVTNDFLSPVEIREVEGPGAPWIVDKAEVRIDSNGRLRVKIEGLVLDPATIPPPPDGPGGTNPVANFRVIVSCIDGVDVSGNPSFTNIVTDTFPADIEGDAELDTMISLPDPSLGIIVFVTSPTERWFAVTGF